jgi:xylulokinase
MVARAVDNGAEGTLDRVSEYLIGVDLGTSGLKAVLGHPQRGVVAVTERGYPMHRPHPGWAENDPEDWFEAVASAVTDLLARGGIAAGEVRAVSFVGQRDIVALVDADGHSLGPCIHWSDRRNSDETERLFDRIGRERLFDISGTSPIPGLVLPNLAWTREHRPGAYANARWALTPKDYIAFRLTGVPGTDPTSLTRSLLNDRRTGGWSDELCREAGLSPSILPPASWNPWQRRGRLDQRARLIGLEPGTVLAAGGGDDPSSCLGCGVIDTGAVSIGACSSSSWRVVSERPAIDVELPLGVMPHVVPGRYLHEMVAVGTGTSMRWLRQVLSSPGGGELSYEELLTPAATVAPGAEGVRFYPYVEGSTVPFENDRVRAAFLGIEAHHTRAHLVRAVLESVAFQYPLMLELMERAGHQVTGITISDGESRSGLWNQIKADVVGQPIAVATVAEATAVGAVILAGMAAGTFADPASGIASLVPPVQVVSPNLEHHARYDIFRRSWEDGREHVFAATASREPIRNG